MHLVRRSLAITVLALASTALWAPAPAGASCAPIVVEPGQVMWAPAIVTIGPIPVDIPAGEYELWMWSVDDGHLEGHQQQQTSERWSFRTSAGDVSPTTPDLAEGLTLDAWNMGPIELAAADSITFVHHGSDAHADSVVPGFLLRCPEPDPVVSAPAMTATPPTVAQQAPLADSSPPTSSAGAGSSVVGTPSATVPSAPLAPAAPAAPVPAPSDVVSPPVAPAPSTPPSAAPSMPGPADVDPETDDRPPAVVGPDAPDAPIGGVLDQPVETPEQPFAGPTGDVAQPITDKRLDPDPSDPLSPGLPHGPGDPRDSNDPRQPTDAGPTGDPDGPSGPLARTGSDTGIGWWAALSIAVGALLVVAARSGTHFGASR